jgi:hypothetical protein
MIAPAVILALTLVQAPVSCDWIARPDGKYYVCAASDNKDAVIAFVCDEKTKAIRQINFTIITRKLGYSGRMNVKSGGKEIQVPMLGIKIGFNGFASPAVPEALEAAKKLLENASGPLTLTPLEVPDPVTVSIDSAPIANALKTATASCKGP